MLPLHRVARRAPSYSSAPAVNAHRPLESIARRSFSLVRHLIRITAVLAVQLMCAGAALAQAPVPTVANFAGGIPASGSGTATSLEYLGGIGRDPSGNFYFGSGTGTILKLDTSGNLSVFAGNGTCCFSGDGMPATSAQTSITPFVPVSGVKVDPAGNVYFVDTGACVIRKIPAGGGNITTVAGTPNTDFNTFSNCGFGGDGGAATNALISPSDIAFDPAGNLYISDNSVCVIRKVDHTTQKISTVAGNAAAGCAGNIGVGDGLAATSAQFVNPYGIAVDGAGNLYVTDFFPLTGPGDVRKISATTNLVSTFAGGGGNLPTNGALATQVLLGGPSGLGFDLAGNLLIADGGLNLVLSENLTSQTLTLLAGDLALGPGFSGDGQAATSAQLYSSNQGGAMDLAVDASGNIYVTDTLNYRVRRVDATTQKISTVAGSGSVGDGGPAASAIIFSSGGAVNAAGDVFLADLQNGRVRRVDHTSGKISTVAGMDVGPTPAPTGDGMAATSAQLYQPRFPAVDAAGDIYVVENTTTVRRVDGTSGVITAYAGTGSAGYNGDGIAAASAQLNNARGLAVNAAGDLYIADAGNEEVRVVNHTSLMISAVAGSHALGAGYTGDGGSATAARLNSPSYVALDAAGNLYITDRGNNVIRMVSASNQQISTVAGNFGKGAGFSGDGGLATAAQLNSPRAAGVDMYGNLYIADGTFTNNRMRVVNSVTGIITTLGGDGSQNYSGDGGAATSAGMAPTTVTIAPGAGGNILIYFSDGLSARERVITVPPVPAVYLAPTVGLTFTSQAVGTPSTGQTVTIANSGTGTLNVSSISFTGNDPGDFAITTGGTCTGTSFALAPTASCTVTITFTPGNFGNRTAFLSFSDDAPGNTQTLPLSGTGLGPGVSPSPTNLAFGNQQEKTGASLMVTITNNGNAALNFTAAPNVTGANASDFAITGATCVMGTPVPPAGAGPAGTCTVTVTFTPSTAGSEMATLNFADNASPAAQTVPLTGTGTVPTVTFNPNAATGVNFGAVNLGNSSGVMSVSVTVGAGPDNLRISFIQALSSSDTSDFAINFETTTCPTDGGTVSAGTMCTVFLTFTPSFAGTENGMLEFVGNDLNGSPVNIPLTGIGASTAAGFTFTATSPGGGPGTTISVLPGDTATFTLVIQPNVGFIGPIMVSCAEVASIPATNLTTSPTTTINVTTSPSPPITVTCTLQTNCNPALVGPRAPWQAPGPMTPAPVGAVSGLALLLAMLCRKEATGRGALPARERARGVWARRLMPMGAAVLLMLLVMTWTACVNNPAPALKNQPTTPSGVYQIQVVATAPNYPPQKVTLTVRII